MWSLVPLAFLASLGALALHFGTARQPAPQPVHVRARRRP